MTAKRLSHGLAAMLTVGAVVACSDAEQSTEVVAGAPEMPAEVTTIVVQSDDTITALAPEGRSLIVGSALGAFSVQDATLLPLEVYDEANTTTRTGTVSAMLRYREQLLIAAEEGMFFSHGDRLVRADASSAFEELTLRDVYADDDDLWAAAKEGLFHYGDKTLSRWKTSSDFTEPNAVAAIDGVVLIAYGSSLVEMYSWMDAYAVADVDTGFIHDITAVGNTAYIGAEKGLFVRAADDGAYTQYTLSDDAPAKVGALRRSDTFVYAASSVGVVRIGGQGKIVGIAPKTSKLPGALALDAFGHVWTARGTKLTGHFVGAPVSYAEAVAPLMVDACASCHGTEQAGAPLIDFADPQTAIELADTIVDRVRDRTMPPPSADALSAKQIETIVRWYETGTQP